MTTLGPTFSIFQSRSWHQCYRREGFLMLTNASLQPTPAPLRGVIDCDIQEGTLAAAFPRKSPPFPSGDDTFIVPSILIIISALVFGSPPPPPRRRTTTSPADHDGDYQLHAAPSVTSPSLHRRLVEGRRGTPLGPGGPRRWKIAALGGVNSELPVEKSWDHGE